MHVVLDTNLVIDLLHFADPRALPILGLLRAGDWVCHGDDACFAELERVLAYPGFALAGSRQRALLAAYRALARPCPASEGEAFVLPRCRDADDQKFLVLAARAGADLLVTRDKALLRLKSFRRGELHCRIVDAPAALRLGSLAAKDPA